MEEDVTVVELDLLASNIKRELCNVLEVFSFFLRSLMKEKFIICLH
jgi:hypothetical protein